MKATECLNAEHGVFLTQLGILDKMLKEKASAEELRAVALSIAAAVEKHADVEEKFLYPAIVREFGQDFPPIAVMEAEHQHIDKCVKGIKANEGGMTTFVNDFIGTLQQHIAKEINVLFPLAEQRISVKELEDMACNCVERYHETAGVKPMRGGCPGEPCGH